MGNHDLEREMGQNFGNDGMYVVMETGNVRLLWCLKGESIWLRRRARSGEVRKEQRSDSKSSQLAIILHPKINMGAKGNRHGLWLRAVCRIFECLRITEE